MQYIVLDMEWNQAEKPRKMLRHPVTLYGEIIQIGAVKVDEDFHVLDTFKIMVRPKYYHRMNKVVANLTQITSEELEYGFPFPVAFKHFRKWCGEDFAFLTWGDSDMQILEDNMRLFKIPTNWAYQWYNVQIIYDALYAKEGRCASLEEAVERVGEKQNGAHDALHDAHSTVAVCRHLDMRYATANYEEMHYLMKLHASHSLSFYYLDEHFPSRAEAAMAIQTAVFDCPLCGQEVHCTELVRQSTDKLIALAECAGGDALFVRFKFRKFAAEDWGVKRIIYERNAENVALYEEKKQLHGVYEPGPLLDE